MAVPPLTTLNLSVVMPAFNESSLLAASVAEVISGLRARGETFEVLVIENGSTDSTPAIADDLAASVPEVSVHHLRDADYGLAIRSGLLSAAGDVVVLFDVDYYDVPFVTDAVNRLNAADDPVIVVGSKRAEGADDQRSLLRRVVTWVFATVLRVGFGLRVSDTHGMKAIRRVPVLALAQSSRFGSDLFDTELILRAQRAGLGIVELPVMVVERRPSRSPIWVRVPRTLWGLVQLRVQLSRDQRKPAAKGATDSAPAASEPGQ